MTGATKKCDASCAAMRAILAAAALLRAQEYHSQNTTPEAG
jgi:hypothetical protein